MEHACRFPARKIDGKVFVGECKVCGASVAAAALALEAERDDLRKYVAKLEAMIPKIPCCPDGFMDEPCSGLIEALARVRELEKLADGTDVSFAALIDSIDSKQASDEAYALIVSAIRRAEKADAAVDEHAVLMCRLWDVLSPMLGEADRRLFARNIEAVLACAGHE